MSDGIIKMEKLLKYTLGIEKTKDQVVQFVRRGIAERQGLDKIAENLMDNCLARRDRNGSRDNMTIIIVGLTNGFTKDEWYDMIADRVNNNEGPVAEEKFGSQGIWRG